jgi:hypothetical protein
LDIDESKKEAPVPADDVADDVADDGGAQVHVARALVSASSSPASDFFAPPVLLRPLFWGPTGGGVAASRATLWYKQTALTPPAQDLQEKLRRAVILASSLPRSVLEVALMGTHFYGCATLSQLLLRARV